MRRAIPESREGKVREWSYRFRDWRRNDSRREGITDLYLYEEKLKVGDREDKEGKVVGERITGPRNFPNTNYRSGRVEETRVKRRKSGIETKRKKGRASWTQRGGVR